MNATGGQLLPVMRPSSDMAVQFKPAPELTRRAMMTGTFGLGVAASNRAAVAEPGTAEFRPAPLGIKQAIPGIPSKAADRAGSIGSDTAENFPPGFLPSAAALAGVLTRVQGLADSISSKPAQTKTAKSRR